MTILTYLHNTIFIATQTSMCRCRVIIWMHYALFNPLPTDGQLRFLQLHVLFSSKKSYKAFSLEYLKMILLDFHAYKSDTIENRTVV